MLCLGTRTDDPRTPEALEPADVYERGQARFPQTVIRPKQKNTMTLEDMPVNCTEIILKWRCSYCIAVFKQSLKFTFFDKQFDEASVGSSITIELENDINVRRYDCKII
jgi:sulfate adenylyltransferase subunit 1